MSEEKTKKTPEEQVLQQLGVVDSGNKLLNWVSTQSMGRILFYLLIAPGIAIMVALFLQREQLINIAGALGTSWLDYSQAGRISPITEERLLEILYLNQIGNGSLSVWSYSISTNPPYISMYFTSTEGLSRNESPPPPRETFGPNTEQYLLHAEGACSENACPIIVNGILWGFVEGPDYSHAHLRYIAYSISIELNPFKYELHDPRIN